MYRFLAGDLSNNIFANLPTRSCRFTEVLNRAGSCELKIPLVVEGYAASTEYAYNRSLIDPWRTTIYVEEDGVIVWGGILITAQADPGSNELTLGCAGLLEYLKYRLLTWTVTYTQWDQTTLVENLLNLVYSISAASIVPDLPNPNPGNVVVPVQKTTGRKRDRVYAAHERKPILEIIDQLSMVIDGFDYAITSEYVQGQNKVVNTFRTYYPYRGKDTGIQWTLFPPNVPGSNISNMSVPYDGTRFANQVEAMGSGDGSKKLIARARNNASLYPLLEKTVDYSTVKQVNTLAEHAAQELVNANPLPTMTIALMPDRPDTIRSAFGVGDLVWVYVDRGWLQLRDDRRVVERSTEVNPRDGTEATTVTVV